MKLRLLLSLLFVTALASAQQRPTSDRQRITELEARVTALQVQVQKLEAALQRAPKAANISVQEQIEALGAQRQAILRARSEFLKTLRPTHPDVLYLDKKLAAVEALLVSAELGYLRN